MKISFLLTEAPQVSVCRCAAQGISQRRAQLPKGQPEEHYPSLLATLLHLRAAPGAQSSWKTSEYLRNCSTLLNM